MGQWGAVNLVHQCEHQLSERVTAAFTSDSLKPVDPARDTFSGALKSREKWDKLEAEVRGRPGSPNTKSWLARNAMWMRGQTEGRSRIPLVYSTSAVEQPLRELRLMLRPRAFVVCNRARVNQLLALIRQPYLRVDNGADYATDIRAYLDLHRGHPVRTYRQAYDTRTNMAGNTLSASLWSAEAQISMREARRRRQLAKSSQRGD